MTAVALVLFALWVGLSLVIAKACALNDVAEGKPPVVVSVYLVTCAHCGEDLCTVFTREQAVLEAETHHLIVHSEGASWTS
ncbi:MAG TPA: hypothetical protein VGL75_09370 [Acidothermaceae bacterium]|jgi:hypothetical protein